MPNKTKQAHDYIVAQISRFTDEHDAIAFNPSAVITLLKRIIRYDEQDRLGIPVNNHNLVLKDNSLEPLLTLLNS